MEKQILILAILTIFSFRAIPNCQGNILRKVTNFDNSSLFSSFNFAISSGKIESDDYEKLNKELRVKLATAIEEHPDEYADVITQIKLYDSVKNYREWILKPTSPGSDIELAILSTYFQLEIAVGDWDKRTFRKPFFGEDRQYTQRIYLLRCNTKTGLHYDVLYDSVLGDKNKTTLFPTSDLETLHKVGEFVFRSQFPILIN